MDKENHWEKKMDRIVNNVNKFMRIHQEYLKKKGLKNKYRNFIFNDLEFQINNNTFQIIIR